MISVAQNKAQEIEQRLAAGGIPNAILGEVGGEELGITLGDERYRWPIKEIHDGWFNAIARAVAA